MTTLNTCLQSSTRLLGHKNNNFKPDITELNKQELHSANSIIQTNFTSERQKNLSHYDCEKVRNTIPEIGIAISRQ